jgi:release factor glutamine methyltransferase
MKLLDMGTGPYGVLARYCGIICKNSSIIAADHSTELINHAKSTASLDNIKYVESDLFSRIDGSFDLMIFNAPYISRKSWLHFHKDESEFNAKRWCGGTDGHETIEKFLNECPGYIKDNGLILLGVNHFYIKKPVIDALIRKSRVRLIGKYSNPVTQAGLYVLGKVQDEKML